MTEVELEECLGVIPVSEKALVVQHLCRARFFRFRTPVDEVRVMKSVQPGKMTALEQLRFERVGTE